jgi:adenylate cyclase
MPAFMTSFEQLLRRHVVNASRPQLLTSPLGYESRRLVVGFVDLVGSTELAGRLSAPDLGAALSAFEATAADIVVSHRGRVVKLIGDEIMFTAPNLEDGCTIAHRIVAAFAAHPVLPPVRAGLAYGDVLTRDGDCFGPTVNLAARITSQAGASEIVVDTGVALEVSATEWTLTPIGTRTLKGFPEPVPLARITRR